MNQLPYINMEIDLLKNKLKDLSDAKESMEQFIEAIPDAEIRLICRLRCMEGLPWEMIGRKMHMERTTVSKKIRRYLQSGNTERSPI